MSRVVLSWRVPWLPGHVADHLAADRGTSRCPPRTRAVWPGEAVFGYGFVCRKLSPVGAVRRRRRRAALVVRALRRGEDDEALRGAVRAALAEQARHVAEPQRHVVADRLDRREGRERRVEDRARCSSGRARRAATSGSSARRWIERNVGSRRALSCTERRSAGVPISSASASVGAAVAQRARRRGAARRTGASVFARNGRVCGSARDGRVERRRRRPRSTAAAASRRVASAANVVSRLRNERGLGLGRGRDDRAPSARAPGRSATAACAGPTGSA